MKHLLTLLLVFLFIACSGDEARRDDAMQPLPEIDRTQTATATVAEEGNVARETEEPPDEPSEPSVARPGETTRFRNVRLLEPRAGATIRTNPFTVRGEARTFENNVVIRVRDARGVKVLETFTTATGEMGTFSPFSKSIYLPSHPGDQVTIDAFEYSAKDGAVQSLVSVTAPYAVVRKTATLYFANQKKSPNDCSRTFPVTRTAPSSVAVARQLVELLLAGPTDAEKKEGFSAPFPDGAQVTGVNLRDGVLTVDFDRSMQNVGGSCRAQALRAMIEQTLLKLPSVRRVIIRAGGSEKLALQP